MDNNLNGTVKDKILKLLELSKRGIGGEAINADLALKHLLKKHGITLEDLLENKLKERKFSYNANYERDLLIWILTHNFGSKSPECKSAGYSPRYRHFVVNLNDVDYVNLKCEFDFYRKLYREELQKVQDDFSLAFIYKHNLFDKDPVDISNTPSRHTKEDLLRIINLEKGLKDVCFHKQIGSDDYSKINTNNNEN